MTLVLILTEYLITIVPVMSDIMMMVRLPTVKHVTTDVIHVPMLLLVTLVMML